MEDPTEMETAQRPAKGPSSNNSDSEAPASERQSAGQEASGATNAYPAWSPRFWHGMRAPTWWKLLASNRFKVTPGRLPIAAGVSLFSPVNDLLAFAQQIIFGRQIRDTEIIEDPIFILGHWRSGTTLLHELLVTDPRFASPNTFQCFAPSHFLISEYLMVRFGNFLLPKKRPMDNMKAGWTLPQEDEFALMNLGLPSTYSRIAFPQTEPKRLEYLNFDGLSTKEVEHWRKGFLWFLKVLSYHYDQKRLVLKSPTHTGRLAELHRLFPNAKFIHLSRDPQKLFPSTIRLWKSLDKVQALHDSEPEADQSTYVGECLTRMYEGYHTARPEIPESQIVEISYETLVANPLETVRMLYDKLQLGSFDAIGDQLATRLENHKSYQPNQHSLDDAVASQIKHYCQDYCERYGYSVEATT